jgi:ParB/RepB/Spo0J family partition protein
MSDDQTTDARISRAVKLEDLRPPETDVRTHRPDADVKSLAASMGDPNVGQLQDVLVHPVDHDETVDEGTTDELAELHREGHPMRIVDGQTRFLAAEHLGWHTLDATIVPEPPDETVVAQLDANTERIDMSSFETIRALHDHYEASGKTLADIGDKTGHSKSHISKLFSALEGPEPLVQAWQHPEHPLEAGHALALMQLVSDNTVQRYAEAGELGPEEAYQEALDDVRMMVDVQADKKLTVTDFRERTRRLVKQTADQLKSRRDDGDPRAEGQGQTAQQRETPAELPEASPCLVCGSDRDRSRRIAIPVCTEDYGMLSDMKERDDVLMAQADTPGPAGSSPTESDAEAGDPAQALAEATGIDRTQAQAVIQEVKQQASQAPHHPED